MIKLQFENIHTHIPGYRQIEKKGEIYICNIYVYECVYERERERERKTDTT